MIELSNALRKRMMAVHGWSSVVGGLLLYAVLITGTVTLFIVEIGSWMSPLAPSTSWSFPVGTGGTVRQLGNAVAEEKGEALVRDITLYSRPGNRIRILFRGDPETPPMGVEPEGVLFDVDAVTQQPVSRYEAPRDQLFAEEPAGAPSNFYSELHMHLLLPEPWGTLIVGIAGFILLIAAITGILLHQHLLRELFTLRNKAAALLRRRDRHVVAGTWALPFAFAIGLSGSYFSLSHVIAWPMLERIEEATAPAAPATAIPPIAPTAAETVDLDRILQDARARADAEATFIHIEHWDTSAAQVTLTMAASGAVVSPRYFTYDGNGVYTGEIPGYGTTTSLGSDLTALMQPLHFGTGAKPFSTVLWAALALLLASVTHQGLRLWTQRRAGELIARRMAHLTETVVAGMPLALALPLPAFLFAQESGAVNVYVAMKTALILAIAAITVMAWLTPSIAPLRLRLRRAGSLALLLIVLARLYFGGPGWISASDQSLYLVIVMDLMALSYAAWLWWRIPPSARDSSTRSSNAKALRPRLQSR